MERVLFLSDTVAGALSKPSLEALSVSRNLAGGSPAVGLIGSSAADAANQIADCGAERFLGISDSELDVSRFSTDFAAAQALIRASDATIVIAPATPRWQRTLPAVAHRLGGRVDTNVVGIEADGGSIHARRWFYRQRMEATLSRSQRPWILLVASGTAAAWSGAPGNATLEAVPFEMPTLRTRVLGEEAASTDAQTIRPDADLLFVAGAGWTKKQDDGEIHGSRAEGAILDFLEKSNASLGSSKSLVDQSTEGESVLGFMSHLNQVGQTGSTPRHAKGLATCCHGEEPHVVGWRFINERRAINLDAGCGWAQGKADVLYVADAFAVMEKVNELLTP